MVKSCPRSISHSYPYRTIYMRRAAASCGNLNFIVNWFCLRNFVDWDSFSIICEANGGILLQVPLREAWQTFFHVYIRWWINIIWGGQWCQSSGSSSKGLVDLFFLNNYGNSVFHLYYILGQATWGILRPHQKAPTCLPPLPLHFWPGCVRLRFDF